MNVGASDASFFFAIEFKPTAFANLKKNYSQFVSRVPMGSLAPTRRRMVHRRKTDSETFNKFGPASFGDRRCSMRNQDFVSDGFRALW